MMLLALPGCCTLHTYIFTAVLLLCPVLCPGRSCSSCSSVGIKPSKLLRTATAPAAISHWTTCGKDALQNILCSISLLRSTQERVRSACFHPSRAQDSELYHSQNEILPCFHHQCIQLVKILKTLMQPCAGGQTQAPSRSQQQSPSKQSTSTKYQTC